ncbi:MAG: hypothetical protein ABSC47_08975 [Terracidiphilus sp.]
MIYEITCLMLSERTPKYSFDFCCKCKHRTTCYPGPSALHTECYENHGDAFQEEQAASAPFNPYECADCRAAMKHSYSDATTPGFFYDRCEKHHEAAPAPERDAGKEQQ